MSQMIDVCGRQIDYLRVSITDRCNLRCQYCMPEDGVENISHENVLRYEEIASIVEVGTQLGIRKVRITGGEPLVRKNVDDLVRLLNKIPGLQDISLTTNGILLDQYAARLKRAGLNRVNISLDSLQRDRYRLLTLRDRFEQAVRGIKTALDVGLDPVKINMVVVKGINDDEVVDFVALTQKYPLHVRFIEFMPLGQSKDIQADRYISTDDIQKLIEEKYELLPAVVRSSGPAQTYKIKDGQGTIGFITPISHNFCAECNKLRLTADGKLRPCLDSNLEIDLRDEAGEVKDPAKIEAKFREAVSLKPGQHKFLETDSEESSRSMFQIGG